MHIGGIEHEINDLKRDINQKADSHEIHTLRSNVDGLERTIRELRSEIDELRRQQQEQTYALNNLTALIGDK